MSREMDWREYWNRGAIVRAVDPCIQVERTLAQRPYSDATVTYMVDRLLQLLAPSPDQTLLDLACGNGMITSRLAAHFRHVTGVDFSEPLIAVARRQFAPVNVEYVVGDVTDTAVLRGRHDRVLLHFSLQYLSPDRARPMFRQLSAVLVHGGRIVLGDVADGDRRSHFYRGARGKARDLFDRLRNRPIIGYWWKPSELAAIAAELGWTLTIHYQPAVLPNHYFRYDAVLDVPAGGRS